MEKIAYGMVNEYIKSGESDKYLGLYYDIQRSCGWLRAHGRRT